MMTNRNLDDHVSGETAGYAATADFFLLFAFLMMVLLLSVARQSGQRQPDRDENGKLVVDELLQRINELGAQVAELEKEKDRLLIRVSELEQTLAQAEKDRHGHQAQLQGLNRGKDLLLAELEKARSELSMAKSSLANALKEAAALSKVRNERDAILAELDKARLELSHTKTALKDALKDAALVGRSRILLAKAEMEKYRLRDSLARIELDNEDLLARLKLSAGLQIALAKANEKLALVEKDRAGMQEKIKAAREHGRLTTQELSLLREKVEIANKVQQQARFIHKELIGLRGNLRRVVLILDASGSMNQRDRWASAVEVVATWLKHLDIDECALLVFSTDVRQFPTNGYFDLRPPNGPKSRASLLRVLDGLKPEGGTATMLALQKAYGYENVDSIILFSDGAPNNGESSEFDPRIAKEIYALCAKHKGIPVNTVGLGDYFQRDLAEFLQRVAAITGGTFLGR